RQGVGVLRILRRPPPPVTRETPRQHPRRPLSRGPGNGSPAVPPTRRRSTHRGSAGRPGSTSSSAGRRTLPALAPPNPSLAEWFGLSLLAGGGNSRRLGRALPLLGVDLEERPPAGGSFPSSAAF